MSNSYGLIDEDQRMRSKYRSRVCSFTTIVIITLVIMIFMFIFSNLKYIMDNDSFIITPDPNLVIAKHGAVASEVANCSQHGVDILKEGGNAIDAAITSMLCVGSIDTFASGIGGGGFMTIRLPNGHYEIIDFRETAPLAAKKDMFVDKQVFASVGGLSIGVPGEIAGMKLAHKKYGKLPWKRLFEPIINMCRNGFPVTSELGLRLKMFREIVVNNPQLSEIYAPNGNLLKEGQILYRTKYAKTLETIANNYTEFYRGSIAESMIKRVKATGGIMTLEDLENYRPIVREPLVGFYRDRKIVTAPEPASGTILIFLLNILEKYESKTNQINGLDLHRIIEALKFGYARHTELGDATFFENKTEHELRITEILSKEYADLVRLNISDNETFDLDYYDPVYEPIDDHGTSHLSVVDVDDMAVSVTSSINWAFGSQVMDPDTEILFNDQMDDFSFYFYFLQKEPGKRPLSSMAPTIIEKNGRFELAIGASGGKRIISSMLQIILKICDFDMNLADAINSPRFHQQLLPNMVYVDSGFHFDLIRHLLDIHHVVQIHNINRREFSSQIQAIRKFENGTIHANNPYAQNHKEIINKPLQQENPIFDVPLPKKQPRKLNIGNAYSSNIDFEVANAITVSNNSTIQECDRFRMRRVKVDYKNNPFINWKIMPNLFKVPKNCYARCSKTETIINGNHIRIDGFSVIPKNMDPDAFFEMEIELNEDFSYCDKIEVRDENKSDENTILSQDGKFSNEKTTQKIRVNHIRNDQYFKSNEANSEKIQYVLKGGRFVQERDGPPSSVHL
ncbi:9677_t:CDS:10 [Dentiscutata erythropus]|uniref:Glutathione hydrolase n=1 Tax=Dentiscutata erythropus TaxID=1348616 RepID=A0A9N9A716_9GLOM|nr:9677_t:CDS:10 [Dentiscutata erythropus]